LSYSKKYDTILLYIKFLMMPDKEYLKSIITDFDDESAFKVIYSALLENDELSDEAIQQLIAELNKISDWMEDSKKAEQMESMRQYLINMQVMEKEERKTELESIILY